MKEFRNMTQLKKFITPFLNSKLPNTDIEDDIIYELISYHPTKLFLKNRDNIEWIRMIPRKPFNNLALFYKLKNKDSIDDISYIACIRNLFGKYNKDKQYEIDVSNAFRNEIHAGVKKDFYIQNTYYVNELSTGKCDNCKKTTSDIVSDHYPIVYSKIFDDFCNEELIRDLKKIHIYENENNTLLLKDTNLANRWLKYHDKIAKFRLLCNSCNSHFGDYGYKNSKKLNSNEF